MVVCQIMKRRGAAQQIIIQIPQFFRSNQTCISRYLILTKDIFPLQARRLHANFNFQLLKQVRVTFA